MSAVIYLVRHGIAADAGPGMSDADRALTEEGVRKTNGVAVGLQHLGVKPDLILSSPLRRAEDIDGCVKMFRITGADSVVSILPVPTEYNPKWVYWLDSHGRLMLSSGEKEPVARRQDLPPAFHRDGSIYVTQREVIFQRGRLYGNSVQGYVMNPAFSANIDTEDDWKQVEERLSEKSTERILRAA